MCNAHNHPPGCTCGWGGGWHSNSYGGYWSQAPAINRWVDRILPTTRQFAPTEQVMKSEARLSTTGSKPGQLSSGRVIPNAGCPVCGSAVYFYQSDDGSRVYFDELGPPWPKHSCTNQLNTKTVSSGAARLAAHNTRWDAEGWHSLESPRVFRIGEGTLRRVRGTYGDVERTFLFRIKDDVTLNVVRFREPKEGVFELSFLARMENTKAWCIGSGRVSEGNIPLVSDTINLRYINDTPLIEAASSIQKIHETTSLPQSESPLKVVLKPISKTTADLSGSLLQELDAIDQELQNLRNRILLFRSKLVSALNMESK